MASFFLHIFLCSWNYYFSLHWWSYTQNEVDLFASKPAQNEIDLFSSPTEPVIPSSVTSTVDLFSIPEPVGQPVSKSENSGPTNNNIVDPFAAVPLNKFDGSDLFGEFTSDTVSSQPSKSPTSDGSHDNMIGNSLAESKTPPKKDPFQVKSGVWSDTLSRGLIDLNISARKFLFPLAFLIAFSQRDVLLKRLLCCIFMVFNGIVHWIPF